MTIKIKINEVYKDFYKYSNQDIKALVFNCNGNEYNLINKLESCKNIIWFELSNNKNYDLLPDNYFDIIFWSNCNIEKELRNIIKIYPKLKNNGKIYFDNLSTSFPQFVRKCLSLKDKQNIPKNIHILNYIFSKYNYSVKIKKNKNNYYPVFIKDIVKLNLPLNLENKLKAL